jgi:hypothetical protein
MNTASWIHCRFIELYCPILDESVTSALAKNDFVLLTGAYSLFAIVRARAASGLI